MKRSLYVVPLAASLAFTAGCAGETGQQTPAAPAPAFTGPVHAEYLKASGSNTELPDQLNDWLREHPDNSITSLSNTHDKRNNVEGFELIVTDTPNNGEHCQYVDTGEGDSDDGPRAYGSAALQQLIESNPDAAFAIDSIPTYHYSDDIGGYGIAGYVVCILPEQPSPAASSTR